MAGETLGEAPKERRRALGTVAASTAISSSGLRNPPTSPLSNAYAALATELTKKEIRSIGGYSLGRVIGEGTFGKVRLGVHRLTGTRVAIKQVPKSLPSYSPTDPSSPLSLLTREIHHHRRLRHPHVLSLFELIATESSIYLVTELCAGGELFDYLVEHGRLSLPETRRIFGQLVLGVAYLHREGVVHRDLKLENVLLDENVNVKIADLGFGREFEKGKWLETRVGTLGYMAPEVVAGSKYLGEQVDVWSLGVILYALVTGSLPFDDDDEGIMRQLILDCKYEMPEWLDEDASSLIRSILTRDPLLRPSLKQILAHPFFTRPPPPAEPEASSSTASSPSIVPKNPSLAPPLLMSEPRGLALAPPVPSADILSSSPDSMLSMSAVKRGKQRAFDTDSSVFSTPVQPRSLPVSLRQTSPPGPFSAIPPHLSAASSPIGGHTTSSTLRRHPSTASIDFGPVAPAPLVPPLMQRTGSAGGVSVKSLSIGPGGVIGRDRGTGSGSGSGSGSSGLARRKSIGSASERLVRLDEDDAGEDARALVASPTPVVNGDASAIEEMEAQAASDIDDEPRIDYLSLFLSTSSAPPLLSSASDQALLKLIADLGFDAGQVAHSIRTSACDSCSAIWWMLKRKREEKARLEGLEAGDGEEGEGTLVRTNSMMSVRHAERLRDPAAVLLDTQGEEDEDSSEEEFEQNEPLEVLVEETPTPPETARPVEERRPSGSSSSSSHSRSREASLRPPSPPRTPSRRASHTPAGPNTPLTPSAAIAAAHRPTTPISPVSPPSQEEAEARLSYFLSDDPVSAHSTAVPSYFPTVEPPSPLKARGLSSSMPRSASRDQLGVVGTSTDEKGDAKRARAGSVSMLARATSAIGQGLASLSNAGTPTTEEGVSPGGIFAGRKGSLPSDDPRLLHQATPPQRSSLPLLSVPMPSMSAPSTPSMPTSSITPPLPSSARQEGAHPPLTATPPRALPERALSPAPSASASSHQGSFSTTSSSARVGRSVSLTGPSSSAGKKSSRGGNLLSTFKLWFGQDPRKRKRASMVPRLGGPASNEYAPVGFGATGIGRSQSMYTTSSPLGRRPTMGSRRSSNNSLVNGGREAGPAGAGVSLSRRSSVSSAHRDYSLSTPGRGMHRRRASDASRTSASERGDRSRPASLRSFSGQQPGKPGGGRRTGRHSRAASTSSAGSYATAKDAVYRRPPTTTTVVRRRHGSHGRRSTDGGGTPGRHHRRTASGASSAHRSSSSGGAGASDGEETVEEEDAGEDPIMEEDEEESAPGTAATSSEVVHLSPPSVRPRPHRTVSGSGSSSDPHSGHGSPVPSMRSSASRGPPAIFTAHKTTHLFGSPLQPHAPSTSSSLSAFDRRTASRPLPQPTQSQQPIRDVFAVKSPKEDGGEWVDEDDDLEGYGGGLGQQSFRNDGNAVAGGAGAGAGTGPMTSPKLADSPVAERVWGGGGGGGASRFEGRYAGLGGAGGGAGGGGRGDEGKWGRVAVVMEEEEEEEE
ncbi:hypothetical protein NBRC10513v2_007402 [Rhodotorula toruloides]